MISQDDIDAFADDLDTADRILERAEHNADPQRLIHAQEVLPMLRAYALMRATARETARFMTGLQAQEAGQ